MQIKIDVDDGQVGCIEADALCLHFNEMSIEDKFTHLQIVVIHANDEMAKKLLDWYLEHQDICLQFHIDSEKE